MQGNFSPERFIDGFEAIAEKKSKLHFSSNCIPGQNLRPTCECRKFEYLSRYKTIDFIAFLEMIKSRDFSQFTIPAMI